MTAGYDGTVHILSHQVCSPASLSLLLWFSFFFINSLSHTLLFDNRCPDGGDTRISLNAFCATYIINRRRPNWIYKIWRVAEGEKSVHTHTRKKELNGKCGSLLRMFCSLFASHSLGHGHNTKTDYTQCSARLTATAFVFSVFFFFTFSPDALYIYPLHDVLPIRTTATEQTHCVVWICGATVPSSRAQWKWRSFVMVISTCFCSEAIIYGFNKIVDFFLFVPASLWSLVILHS